MKDLKKFCVLSLGLFLGAPLSFAADKEYGLEDTIPIKAGYFFELDVNAEGFNLIQSFNDANLSEKLVFPHYSLKCTYEEAKNKLWFIVTDNFQSNDDIKKACEYSESFIRHLFKRFHISKSISWSLEVDDLTTSNFWEYKNGQLIYKSNPEQDALNILKLGNNKSK